MSQKISVNLRLDRDVKDSATLLAQDLGTNLSTIMNMFLVKFVVEKKFEVGVWHDVFQNVSQSEAQEIESLANFSTFANAIRWK